MPPDPRHELGRLGERLAREHLERLGYSIVARNYRTRHGELDIVARDRDALVFIEVKTRRCCTTPLEAVDFRKQRQIRTMARSFLLAVTDRPYVRELRFDAIGVSVDRYGALERLEHLERAF
jgi:putative endonuclease